MLKKILISIFSYLTLSFQINADSDTHDLTSAPPISKQINSKENHFFIYPQYEYGFVKINQQKTLWKEAAFRAAYLKEGLQCPYIQIENYSRSGMNNETFNAGFYHAFSYPVYLNMEAGWGKNISYVYRNKYNFESEWKFRDNFYPKAGYRFLSYDAGNVNIPFTGFTYYYKQHYLITTLLFPFTEDRGKAYSVSLRLNSDWNENFSTYLSAASGTRLYDVFPLKNSSAQKGSIFSVGFKKSLSKNARLNLGFSYSEEKPSFRIKTWNTGVEIRF